MMDWKAEPHWQWWQRMVAPPPAPSTPAPEPVPASTRETELQLQARRMARAWSVLNTQINERKFSRRWR